MSNPPPGAFGLSVIEGKAGKFVKWGQSVVERQDYQFTHAFFVLDKGQVIEAEPGGAEIVSIDKYLDRPDVLFCDYPVQGQVLKAEKLWKSLDIPWSAEDSASVEQSYRSRLCVFGRNLAGTPYSYLDYVSLAAERFNIKIPLVERRVKRQDRLICSQLVDFVYLSAGIHLFDDGRVPCDVTPGDLEHYVYESHPW